LRGKKAPCTAAFRTGRWGQSCPTRGANSVTTGDLLLTHVAWPCNARKELTRNTASALPTCTSTATVKLWPCSLSLEPSEKMVKCALLNLQIAWAGAAGVAIGGQALEIFIGEGQTDGIDITGAREGRGAEGLEKQSVRQSH
jgi:hypothetical protein